MSRSVETFIKGLSEIPERDFTLNNVYDFIAANPVDVSSIAKYFFWSQNFYTRNLIYKDERFELMAVCWEKGQQSRVHNHSGQQCWMAVPVGRLRGQNFAVAELDEARGHCRLTETDAFEISASEPAKVELDEPVHQVLNLEQYNERAVSLHVYSKPYDRCLSYCRDTDTFKEVQLYYTSIDGKLLPHVRL